MAYKKLVSQECRMSSKRYTDEFKIEVVKQVIEEGHSASSVASRLGMNVNSIYNWIKKYNESDGSISAHTAEQEEIARLKKELKRVTQERDILKKATAYFAKESQ